MQLCHPQQTALIKNGGAVYQGVAASEIYSDAPCQQDFWLRVLWSCCFSQIQMWLSPLPCLPGCAVAPWLQGRQELYIINRLCTLIVVLFSFSEMMAPQHCTRSPSPWKPLFNYFFSNPPQSALPPLNITYFAKRLHGQIFQHCCAGGGLELGCKLDCYYLGK